MTATLPFSRLMRPALTAIFFTSALFTSGCAAPVATGLSTLDGRPPLVIAHRGASGELPEETLEAYAHAIDLGADVIEMDLVATKDGVLITRHDADLGITTDIASRPEFAARKRTVRIAGKAQAGWFSHDFTLAEINTLRAIAPDSARPQQFNGLYRVPTLQMVLDLAAKASRPVAVYIETKDPAYFRGLGLPLEETLTAELRARGWDRADAPVFLQSFEADSLKRMRAAGVTTPMVQLMGGSAVTTSEQLAAIKGYANGIGPSRRLLGGASTLIQDAHRAGLFVHPYTYNQANDDFAAAYRSGVDGVFTDFTAQALAARTLYLTSQPGPAR